ncbi:MAG: 3'-5' exonuclease [Alphaproteobacteria bacterium]|nr:3'-5' exonuclease [Alphaproteobacteria bacterium]
MHDTYKDIARKLEAHHDFRVLRRLQPRDRINEATAEVDIRNGLVFDVETTGLDTENDEVIEVAAVPFTFSSDGRLFSVGAAATGLPGYEGLQEPPAPLSEDIKNLTGLTDEMLAGQRINLSELEAAAEPAHLVIAHNAGFDRKFAERLSPIFQEKAWGCSFQEVPWREEGFRHQSLEAIAIGFGCFFDGHRAGEDCRALLELLSRPLPLSGRTGFSVLVEHARQATIRIWAEGAPFEKKDALKARGYVWSSGEDGRLRCWYRDVPETGYDEEVAWLEREVYLYSVDLFTTRITAKARYSGRV